MSYSRRQAVRDGSEMLFWYIAIVLVLGVVMWFLALAFLGLHSATAGLIGRANVHIQNESAPNRIVQQAGFEVAFADVTKYKQQIIDAKAALADWDKVNGAKPDNAIGTLASQRAYLQLTLTGATQQCQNTVATYNADTHKTLAKDWKRSDLPYELTDSDCK